MHLLVASANGESLSRPFAANVLAWKIELCLKTRVMNLIRSLMSFFLLAVIGLSIAGWIWAGEQPSSKMIGARVALALCGLMAVGAIGLLWSAKETHVVEK